MTSPVEHCAHCDGAISAGDRYCGICGAPVTTGGSPEAAPPEPAPQEPPRPSPRAATPRRLRPLLLGGVAVVLLAGAIIWGLGSTPGGRAPTSGGSYLGVPTSSATKLSTPELLGRLILRLDSPEFVGLAPDGPLHSWRAYLDGPAQVLKEIARVDYDADVEGGLDGGPAPDADNQFAVTGTGRGRFRLRATVVFRDGSSIDRAWNLEVP